MLSAIALLCIIASTLAHTASSTIAVGLTCAYEGVGDTYYECSEASPTVVEAEVKKIVRQYFSDQGTVIPEASLTVTASTSPPWEYGAGFMLLTFTPDLSAVEDMVFPNIFYIFNSYGYVEAEASVFSVGYNSELEADGLLFVFESADDGGTYPPQRGTICASDFTQYDALALCRANYMGRGGLDSVRFERREDPNGNLVRMRQSPGCSARYAISSACPNYVSSLLPFETATSNCPAGVIYLECDLSTDATDTPSPTAPQSTAARSASVSVPDERRGVVTLTAAGGTGPLCASVLTGLSFNPQSLCLWAGLETISAVAFGVPSLPNAAPYVAGSLDCYSGVASSIAECDFVSGTVSCPEGMLTAVRCPVPIGGSSSPRPSAVLFTFEGDGVSHFDAALFMGRDLVKQIVVTAYGDESISFYVSDPPIGTVGPVATELEAMWSDMSLDYFTAVIGAAGPIRRSTAAYTPTASPTTTEPPPPSTTGGPAANNDPVAHDTTGWSLRVIPFSALNPSKGFLEVAPLGRPAAYVCAAGGVLGPDEASAMCKGAGFDYALASGFVAPSFVSASGLGAMAPAITSLICNAGASGISGCLFYYNESRGSIPCAASQIIALQCGPDVTANMTAVIPNGGVYNSTGLRALAVSASTACDSRVKLVGDLRRGAHYSFQDFTILDPDYSFVQPTTAPGPPGPAPSGACNNTGSGIDLAIVFTRKASFESLAAVGVDQIISSTEAYASFAVPPPSASWVFGLTLDTLDGLSAFGVGMSPLRFGRLTLSVSGTDSGSVSSVGIDKATALNLCAAAGVVGVDQALIVPHTRPPYVSVPAYASGLSCSGVGSCTGTVSDIWTRLPVSPTHFTDVGLVCGRGVLPEGTLFSLADHSLVVYALRELDVDALPLCISRLIGADDGRITFGGGGPVGGGAASYMLRISDAASPQSTAQDLYMAALMTSEWALLKQCGGSRFLRGGALPPPTVTVVSTLSTATVSGVTPTALSTAVSSTAVLSTTAAPATSSVAVFSTTPQAATSTGAPLTTQSPPSPQSSMAPIPSSGQSASPSTTQSSTSMPPTSITPVPSDVPSSGATTPATATGASTTAVSAPETTDDPTGTSPTTMEATGTVFTSASDFSTTDETTVATDDTLSSDTSNGTVDTSADVSVTASPSTTTTALSPSNASLPPNGTVAPATSHSVGTSTMAPTPTAATSRSTSTASTTPQPTPSPVTTTAPYAYIINFFVNSTVDERVLLETLAALTNSSLKDIKISPCKFALCVAFQFQSAAMEALDAAERGALGQLGVYGAAFVEDQSNPSDEDGGGDDDSTVIIIIVIIVVALLLVGGGGAAVCYFRRRGGKREGEDFDDNAFLQLIELDNYTYSPDGEGPALADDLPQQHH